MGRGPNLDRDMTGESSYTRTRAHVDTEVPGNATSAGTPTIPLERPGEASVTASTVTPAGPNSRSWALSDILGGGVARSITVANKARHGGAVAGRDPPFLLDPDVDADASAPRERPLRLLPILDAQRARGEIEEVLTEVDAERLRQVARPAAQFVDVHVH